MRKSFALVGFLALLAAGCGGSHPTTTTTTGQNAIVAYSNCMRSNGVPDFPDPQQLSPLNFKLSINRLQTNAPAFQTAQRTCAHLLPSRAGNNSQQSAAQERARIAAELSFARCMRSHGLSQFPDPNSQGELTVEMVVAQGIDVHSPSVLRTVQTCIPASHGWLTPAKVREAIANNQVSAPVAHAGP
ncbi:MAG: hypothetical protein JO186_08930 [Actinobacteria bacterium]|nr:hypothetical protein [Actinomycetota bacterium]MBV8396907.1 hypothetical protein [Actinomycetota bacterium]MBV8599578.1 hypothetical protein [Actinomycetota bacterium]